MNSTWSLLKPASPLPPARATGKHVRLHAVLAMLLALTVALLAVVADRAIGTWADGHIFLAWLAGWAVIFAATALLDSWHRQRTAARLAPARASASKRTVPVHDGEKSRRARDTPIFESTP